VSLLLARLAIAALLAAAPLAAALPAMAQPLPGTSCALFPSDNILNTDISALPVHAQSQSWKGNMTQHQLVHPDFGTFAQGYGIPINVAPPPSSGMTPTFGTDSESDHPAEGYPIDQATQIEGGPGAGSGTDRHALIVNKSLCKLYEIYNLQNFSNGQQPVAGSGAVWDLGSDAMRPIGWTSADAAGLPITPLLLRPDEILAGSITHAVRFTTHCTHGYIWPGSHDAGLCGAGFPPMGARFRLSSGFDISGFAPTTQVVLRAFQRYGLILADNGADWYVQGSTDDWWGTPAGDQVASQLKTIPAAQFDAVDESSLQAAASSYRATGTSPGPGALAAGPDVASWGVNRLDVVVVGSDQQAWHRSWDGAAWNAWDAQGGRLAADPGASTWGSGRLDIFGLGADGALWHRWLDAGAWHPWESLGGRLVGGPSAASTALGHLDVFAVGTDRALWHRSWNGAQWSAWDSQGGVLISDPGVASQGPNHLDVFGRGSDNQLWQKSWNGSQWSAWQPLGGVLSSAPAAASQGPNRLDVFGRGQDNQLWHRSWTGTLWNAWEPLGGSLTSGPGATSWGANRLDVFVRGGDLRLWHRSWDGILWSAWLQEPG
jgi:hypothetical protein